MFAEPLVSVWYSKYFIYESPEQADVHIFKKT